MKAALIGVGFLVGAIVFARRSSGSLGEVSEEEKEAIKRIAKEFRERMAKKLDLVVADAVESALEYGIEDVEGNAVDVRDLQGELEFENQMLDALLDPLYGSEDSDSGLPDVVKRVIGPEIEKRKERRKRIESKKKPN